MEPSANTQDDQWTAERIIGSQQAQISELTSLVKSLMVNQVIPEQNKMVLSKQMIDLIPTFDGNLEGVKPFLEVTQKLYDEFFDHSRPDSFQNFTLLSAIKSKIVPPAAELISASDCSSFDDIKKAILGGFQDRRDSSTLVIQLTHLRQQDGEDPFKFHDRVLKLLRLLIGYSRAHEDPRDADVLVTHFQKLGLRVFLMHLRDPLGSSLRARNPESLSQALGLLTNDYQMMSNPYRKPSTTHSQPYNHPKNLSHHPRPPPPHTAYKSAPTNPKSGFNAFNNQRFPNNNFQQRPSPPQPTQQLQPWRPNVTPNQNSKSRMSWQTTPNYHQMCEEGTHNPDIPDHPPYETVDDQDYLYNPENDPNPESPTDENQEAPFLEETGLNIQNTPS